MIFGIEQCKDNVYTLRFLFVVKHLLHSIRAILLMKHMRNTNGSVKFRKFDASSLQIGLETCTRIVLELMYYV